MKKTSSIIFAVFVILFTCETGSANVPIGAAAFLAYPTISYFNSSIVALIIVVILESLIFYRITKLDLNKSFVLVFMANIISSLLGIVLAFSFSSSILFFIMLLPIALIFS